jgi:23S rRNA G2445 N2-methylase RlmL
MNIYVAHTIKGLEFITEMELTDKFQDLQILSNEPKKIIFESDYTPQSSNLRTFDNLSLLVTKTEFRDESEVVSLIESIDLEKVREITS